jgi:hypothetical protein
MRSRFNSTRTAPLVVSVAALALGIVTLGRTHVAAQGGAQPLTPQAASPIDMTGYWVSVVTEDWRWRMVTPPKGDFASIPLNAEGRRVGDMWDPDKDTAEGNACKSYGAPAIMRVPGRVHITWQDPNTMKVETDAGQQTRLFHFQTGTEPMQAPAGDQGWQGYSVATWEYAGGRGPGAGGGRGGPGGGGPGGGGPPPAAGAPPAGGQGGAAAAGGQAGRGGGRGQGGGGGAAFVPMGGDLKVETSHFKAGYLRKNGPPYSANAQLTEYYDRHKEPNGDEWLTVTTIVHDPQYLNTDFITSTHFKKEADAAKWRPQPCVAK